MAGKPMGLPRSDNRAKLAAMPRLTCSIGSSRAQTRATRVLQWSFALVAAPAFLALLACSSPSKSNEPSLNNAAVDASMPDDASEGGSEAGPPLQVTCTSPSELVLLPQVDANAPFRPISPAAYEYGRCELVALIVDAAIDLRAATPAASPIGVGDLSQLDGEIPGTDVGAPRHPAPSHTKGFSADLTYFRLAGKTLEDTPACPSKTREFCEGPHDVDVAPTATLFARLASSKRVVQIIVDPVMVDDLTQALDALITKGTNGAALAKAVLTSGIPFHADHFHISLSRACFDGRDNDGDGKVDLDDPDCADAVDDDESR